MDRRHQKGILDPVDDEDRRKRRRGSKWDPDADPGAGRMEEIRPRPSAEMGRMEELRPRPFADARPKSVAELPQQPMGELQYSAVDTFRATQARYMEAARQLRARVYVGPLDLDVQEQEIMTVFQAFGQVHNVHMPREGGRSHGYCFVEYLDQRAADLAILHMQNWVLRGRRVRVTKPTEQRRPQVAPQGLSGVVGAPMGLPTNPVARGASAELRLVTISGLATNFDLKEVSELCQPYGPIVKCGLVQSSSATAAFKPGFAGRAAVEYDTELSAFSALRALQGFASSVGVLQLHLGLPGSTDVATPAAGGAASAPAALQNDPVVAVTSKILHIENMVGPGEADEDLADEVREETEKFGKVKDVKVEEYGPKKEVRVIVTFTALGGVAKAVKALNGRWFGGRQIRAAAGPYTKQRHV